MKPATKFGIVLGQVVVKKRKELKLTQGNAAKKMGLPQSSLSRLERGSASFTVGQLRRAAGVLHVQVSNMFREAEAGAAALTKKGVKILDEEPPEEERHRWVWVAPEEIEQTLATIRLRSDSDMWVPKPREKDEEKLKTYLRRP
jgi:transcriptional regulator with XRE-family HTH domain